jgi:hypothetical protein
MPLDYDFHSLEAFTLEHFNSLSEVLSSDLIDKCLKESGIVTLRKRRLPLEMMVWSIVGMSIFRHLPVSDIVINSISCFQGNASLWHRVLLSRRDND